MKHSLTFKLTLIQLSIHCLLRDFHPSMTSGVTVSTSESELFESVFAFLLFAAGF